MSIVVTAGSSGPKSEPVSAGTHAAICYGVVDLGTQVSEQYGAKRKVALLWEIPEERIEVKGKNLPRGISKRYTATLNEKGTLRKDLESWRGRSFTAQELAGFDLGNIIGKSCFINVLHKNTPRGVFADVGAVMPLPKGMPHKTAENPLINFSITEAIEAAKKSGKQVDFPDGLPQWLADVCSKSEEYVAFVNGGPTSPPPAPEDDHLPPINEEVPF
jgi:hypothetical protein